MASQSEKYDAVKAYVAHLQHTDGNALHRSLYKAGVTSSTIAQIAVDDAADMGFDLQASDLVNGLEIKEKDAVALHFTKNKNVKGRAFLNMRMDGVPTLSICNYTSGEEAKTITYNLDEINKRGKLPPINDKGWLEYEALPAAWRVEGANYDAAKRGISVVTADDFDSPEVREMQEQRRQEREARQAREAAELEKARQEGAVRSQERVRKAEWAYDKNKEKGLGAHANHRYVLNKTRGGEYLGVIEPLMQQSKNFIADAAAHFQADKDKISDYPLLLIGRNIETNEIQCVQRIMTERAQNEAGEWITKLNEKGEPNLVKRFEPGSSAVDSHLAVFNSPGPNITTMVVTESAFDALVVAKGLDVENNPQKDSILVTSIWSTSNASGAIEGLKKQCPNLKHLFYAPDDDGLKSNGTNPGMQTAAKIFEEHNAMLITPPREYMKPTDSDWSDIFQNIYDVVKQKNGGVVPDQQAYLGVFQSIVHEQMKKGVAQRKEVNEQYAANMKKAIEEQPAPEVTEQPQNTVSSPENAISQSADNLIKAMQDKNFKLLVVDVLNTSRVLDETAGWQGTQPLIDKISATEFPDNELSALPTSERTKVLRTAAVDLAKALTGGYQNTPEGYSYKQIMEITSAGAWKSPAGYRGSFIGAMKEAVTKGENRPKENAEPGLIGLLDKKVAEMRMQNKEVLDSSVTKDAKAKAEAEAKAKAEAEAKAKAEAEAKAKAEAEAKAQAEAEAKAKAEAEAKAKAKAEAIAKAAAEAKAAMEAKAKAEAEAKAKAEAEAKAKAEAEAKAKAEAEAKAKAKAEAEAKAKAEAEAKAKAEAEAKAKAEAEAKAKAEAEMKAKSDVKTHGASKPETTLKSSPAAKKISKDDFIDMLEDRYMHTFEEAEIIAEVMSPEEFRASMNYIKQDMGIKDKDEAAEFLVAMTHEIHSGKTSKEDSELFRGLFEKQAKLENRKKLEQMNPAEKRLREVLTLHHGMYPEDADKVMKKVDANELNNQVTELEMQYPQMGKEKAFLYVVKQSLEKIQEEQKLAKQAKLAQEQTVLAGASVEQPTVNAQAEPSNDASNTAESTATASKTRKLR